MAPSSSCHVTEIKHDVFISFRGTDVRKGLLSHLKKALRCRQIDIYVDERLDRGDEISSSLLRAIEESQILLVIFSKDYASSKWCLEELAKMIECVERNKRILLPVFFNVDPSHVRNHYGEYGDALAKHEETLKVQSWRSALKKAGHFSGFHYPTNYEDESDLVDKIVEDIWEKLSKFCPSESNGLVGIDQNIAQIQSLLLMESSEVRFVGIWGMGGIGKTSIARAIFDKYSTQYDGSCFLNVREELVKQQGLSQLRERLISELLEGEVLHTSGTSKAIIFNSAVRRIMGRKRVLVVLDDVNTSEQLKCLVGEGICFGGGSRVIITSRDKHVLTSGGVHQIHEVKEMDTRDSLKLFCLNAFNESLPKTGYEKLSEEVVKNAHGNPLALKVLGSDFHSRSRDTWECALSKIKKYPNEKIQTVLRFSYDELNDVEKNAFLDIVFFFIKEKKDYVTRRLDAWGFYGASAIEVLQQKALITISNDNIIQMHDLIRQMGFEIDRQESIKYPGRCRRLRNNEDVHDVLRNKLGTDEVEAMQIDVTSQIADLPLNVHTFKKMSRLRFIKFNYPLHAELSMPPNHVEALLQDILDSKIWDLNRSNMLVELPQSSMATKLEFANLKSCHSPHDLVNSSSIQGIIRSKQLMGRPDYWLSKKRKQMELPDLAEREYRMECESLCDADHEAVLSLQKQVALLLSGHEELISIASEVHIKCLYYHHFIDNNNSDVNHQQFMNLPMRSRYLKISKSTGQDTGKPKLHILFDGLRFSRRISSRAKFLMSQYFPIYDEMRNFLKTVVREEVMRMLSYTTKDDTGPSTSGTNAGLKDNGPAELSTRPKRDAKRPKGWEDFVH